MKKNKKKLDKNGKSAYRRLQCPKCSKMLFEYRGKLNDDIIIKCPKCGEYVYPAKVQ